MERTTKIWIAACAAAAVGATAIAGAAVADRGGHHGMSGGVAAMLERYDANKDGSLSQEEIDSNRTQWHGEFDADNTGDLSLTEFQNLWLRARREMMVREFQEFDRDGDGKLTLDEYKAPLAMLVTEMDANNDGVLNDNDRRRRRGRSGGDDDGTPQAPSGNN